MPAISQRTLQHSLDVNSQDMRTFEYNSTMINNTSRNAAHARKQSHQPNNQPLNTYSPVIKVGVQGSGINLGGYPSKQGRHGN